MSPLLKRNERLRFEAEIHGDIATLGEGFRDDSSSGGETDDDDADALRAGLKRLDAENDVFLRAVGVHGSH